MITSADIDDRFTHHPPGDQHTIHRHEQVRAAAKTLALLIVDNTAPSREQSLALTACEEAMFWANAAIARHDSAYTAVASAGEAVTIPNPREPVPLITTEPDSKEPDPKERPKP